ncbi:hypothetical protein [Enterobacter hormaechei]|uniref:hypothetical protein n=1 Tax=Enterobacter hormaechei TaxID=158836 RepID=UPI0022B51CB7|nr:hypothetical protein [Enterobacter hormaechei]MCZ5804902.1 hypothetical protein [Enterobacter hormaechei]
MTVSTVVDHNDYTGNGVTTSFPYTFRIFKKTDLTVSVIDLSENITVLVLDTDYTVTNAGGYNGGNVVLTAPLATGWQISIARELEPTQETDLRNQGKFFAEVHEDAFDKLTMLIQQAYSVFRLALRKPSSIANWYDALNNYIRNVRDPRDPQDAATKNYVDTVSSSNLSKTLRTPESIPSLPDAAARANKMIAFDSGGIPIVVVPPSGSASDVLIELAKPTGSGLVHHHGENFPDQPLSLYLAWRNGDISAFGGKYDDTAAGALNKAAFAEMESTFGGVRLNLMGKSVYLPDDMNIQVSSVDVWGGGNIHASKGIGFVLKEHGYINCMNFHVEGISTSTSTTPRLFGVSLGSAYKVSDISFNHFTVNGRVVLFSGLGQLSVNPEEVNYGCNSIRVSNFKAENTYDHLIVIVDWPFNSLEVSDFYIHNMAGTFLQASTNNENVFEQQLQKAMVNVSVHDYSIVNDDDFWADGSNTYTSLGVFECWNLNHYNGYQSGIKVKVDGNVLYDIYNGARLVTESDITIVDLFAWNDAILMPHKIKGAYQYTSQNKRWYYRRGYILKIKTLFPTITEANSKGSFFYPETQDWHKSPVGPLEYGNRFIHIDNCDIELINLGAQHGNAVLNNIRLTNNHFSSLSTMATNFVVMVCYPMNIYQQISISNNRFDTPSAIFNPLLTVIPGSTDGGGAFSGIIEISDNTGRFGGLRILSDYSPSASYYSSSMLSIKNNSFVSSSYCEVLYSGILSPKYDFITCTNNYLNGSTSCRIGQLWNCDGKVENSFTLVGGANVAIFEVGIPTSMNVASNTYYLNITGSNGEKVTNKFVISKSATATSINFTDDSGSNVTKTTGVSNGSFLMKSTSTDGFDIGVIVSNTSIVIQAQTNVRSRYQVSGYSLG